LPHTWLSPAAWMPYSSTASLRLVRGFPALGLLWRLRPPRKTSPDWAACRASLARRSREVPWFKRLTLDAVGVQLYPWLRRPFAVSGQGVGASMSDARSRQEKDQPRSGNVSADAGSLSLQRLPSLASGERKHRPLVFTMASTVARLGATCSLRTVKAVRLLQAAIPILATFTAPFYTRPDPGEDDIFRSSVYLLIARRTTLEQRIMNGPRRRLELIPRLVRHDASGCIMPA
jgi:hypothetical protein